MSIRRGKGVVAGMEADVAVVGGGPAGYVAALRAAQLGARVVLVEEDRLGGTCLNRGCIPTKALLHVARTLETVRQAGQLGVRLGAWSLDLDQVRRHRDRAVRTVRAGVEALLQAAGVEVVRGHGRLAGPGRVEIRPPAEGDAAAGGQAGEVARLEAGAVILAPGSRPAPAPFRVDAACWDSDAALALELVPGRLAVIGGGPVGVEFALLYAAFGARVTLIEALPRLLPREDGEIGAALARSLERRGVTVRTGVGVERLERGAGGEFRLFLGGLGGVEPLEADAVLVAVGRHPATQDLGLETAGLGAGWIQVDDTMRTAVPGIFAAGDATGRHLLAHAAAAHGVVAAEAALGHPPSVRLDLVPSCVFTWPEAAGVGLSEEAARSRGMDVLVGRFPFSANGRATAQGEREGFVKVVAEAGTGRLVGAHAFGPEASTLIHEAALGIAAHLTLDAVARTIHAHPTFSEALVEACLMASGRPLHWPASR